MKLFFPLVVFVSSIAADAPKGYKALFRTGKGDSDWLYIPDDQKCYWINDYNLFESKIAKGCQVHFWDTQYNCDGPKKRVLNEGDKKWNPPLHYRFAKVFCK